MGKVFYKSYFVENIFDVLSNTMAEDFCSIYEYMYDNNIEFNHLMFSIWDYIVRHFPYKVMLLQAGREDLITSDREVIAAVVTMYIYDKDIKKDIEDTDEAHPEFKIMDYIRSLLAGAKIEL